MSDQHETVLRAAWENFCDELKRAVDIPFRDPAPRHVVERVAGIEALARNISLALNFNHDYADPRFPELIHYFDPVRKQGGDNTDAVYVGATINGTDTYRISGDREPPAISPSPRCSAARHPGAARSPTRSSATTSRSILMVTSSSS